MFGARPAVSRPTVPIAAPVSIQGCRDPHRERVRSDSTPKTGCASIAAIADRELIRARCWTLAVASNSCTWIAMKKPAMP